MKNSRYAGIFHALSDEYITWKIDDTRRTNLCLKNVVITGSPRKNGNSFVMTDAFIRAEEQKGHTITRFDAALMNVSERLPCLRNLF